VERVPGPVDVPSTILLLDSFLDKGAVPGVRLPIAASSQKIPLKFGDRAKSFSANMATVSQVSSKWHKLIPSCDVSWQSTDRSSKEKVKGRVGDKMSQACIAHAHNSVKALFTEYIMNGRLEDLCKALRVPVAEIEDLKKELPFSHVISAYLFTQIPLDYPKDGPLGLRFFFFNEQGEIYAPKEPRSHALVTRAAQLDPNEELSEERIFPILVYRSGGKTVFGDLNVNWVQA